MNVLRSKASGVYTIIWWVSNLDRCSQALASVLIDEEASGEWRVHMLDQSHASYGIPATETPAILTPVCQMTTYTTVPLILFTRLRLWTFLLGLLHQMQLSVFDKQGRNKAFVLVHFFSGSLFFGQNILAQSLDDPPHVNCFELKTIWRMKKGKEPVTCAAPARSRYRLVKSSKTFLF